MNGREDKKMKDLTERMVAMSPEPPPFPEEVNVTNQAPTPVRRPMLVFAGAALAVLIAIGVPLVLLNSGDGPPVASPDTSTTSTPTTLNPDETTTSPPVDETSTTDVVDGPNVGYVHSIFLVAESKNSFQGDPALVPLETTVQSGPDADEMEQVRATLNMLGDPGLQLPDGFTNLVPAGVEALDVRRAEGEPGALIIEMNEAFLDGAGGLLADFTMLNQLIYTATGAQPDIVEVQFIVNNAQVTQFGSDGLDLSSSVNRETFEENLALIYLTSPILPNQEGNIVVEGRSNTFEATLMVQVLDGNGAVAHEEFTTATCGNGCWGDYQFVLDSDLFDPDSTVEVFEYSAENGERVNIVSVPYNGGELWDFLP